MSSHYEDMGKKHASENNPGIKEEIPKAIELVKKLKQKIENNTISSVEKDALIYLTALINSMNDPNID